MRNKCLYFCSSMSLCVCMCVCTVQLCYTFFFRWVGATRTDISSPLSSSLIISLAKRSREKVTNKLPTWRHKPILGSAGNSSSHLTNAVRKCGAIIVSHGTPRCRFLLCSPTVCYHGRRCDFSRGIRPRDWLVPSAFCGRYLLRACWLRQLMRIHIGHV